MAEFKTNWGFILIGVGVTFVFSYLFMFCIKFMASVMIWVALFALLAICGMGATVLIMLGK